MGVNKCAVRSEAIDDAERRAAAERRKERSACGVITCNLNMIKHDY